MITTTYNYSSGSGFVYDASKVTFIGGMAELLLGNNPGQTFTPSLSAASLGSGLIYTGGAIQQVDQRPATATYYAAWTSQINANWSGTPAGSLTVTPSGTAAIDSGGLDLTGYGASTYVTLNTANNLDTTGTGTIEFQVTPNYSGNPTNNQNFISVAASAGSQSNLITIFHSSTGALSVQIHNTAGTASPSISGAWSPVSGTTYTLTLQYTSGATTLFINGVSFITSAATWTRTGVTYAIIGQLISLGQPPNFWIKNFSWYSTVVTPSSAVLAATIYLGATATLPEFTYPGIGSLQDFTAFATTDSGGVVYTLNAMYWNGSAWVASSGAYGQANSATVINANIAALGDPSTLQINAIYPAGAVQASLSALTATYTGQIYPTTGPTIYPNSSLTMDSLSVFTDVNTHPTNSYLYWYLKISGTPYWYNGTAWAISNGSFAQSNPAGTIQTNAASIPISLGAYVIPVAILYSSDGLETPTLTSLTLSYDFFGPEPTPPNVCEVFGYIVDEKEAPIVGATITAINPTTYINQGIVIAQGQRTAVTDSIGYFSMSLVETASLSGTNPVTFQVAYTQANVGTGFTPTTYIFGEADIPNTPSANFATLTFL